MWTFKVSSCFLLALLVYSYVDAQPNDSTYIEFEPHIVKITLDEKFKCVGNIVGIRWIVTVANCIYGNGGQPTRFKIYAGTEERANGVGDKYDVEKIFRHALYNPQTFNYDVAMLKTTENIIMYSKAWIVPLCSAAVPAGVQVTSTGWDDTTGAGYSELLRTVKLKTITLQQCKNMYAKLGREVTNTQMCTAVPNGNKCYGNSGSPLSYRKELCGLVSWRTGCAIKEAPNVFTNIMAVKSFIQNTMAAN